MINWGEPHTSELYSAIFLYVHVIAAQRMRSRHRVRYLKMSGLRMRGYALEPRGSSWLLPVCKFLNSISHSPFNRVLGMSEQDDTGTEGANALTRADIPVLVRLIATEVAESYLGQAR